MGRRVNHLVSSSTVLYSTLHSQAFGERMQFNTPGDATPKPRHSFFSSHRTSSRQRVATVPREREKETLPWLISLIKDSDENYRPTAGNELGRLLGCIVQSIFRASAVGGHPSGFSQRPAA